MEERQRLASPASTWRDALLAASLDAIIIMDSNGVIREFNQAAEGTFGFSYQEAVGNTVAETIVPAEMRDAHRAGLRHYLATGKGRILNRRVEIEGQRKDGTRFPVELTIVPVESDGVAMFAGFLRDLSDQKAAQQEIQRANQVAVLLREIPLRASRADTFEDAARVALEQVCRFAGWPVGHAYIRDPQRDVLRPAGIWYMDDPGRFAKFREITDRTEFSKGEGLPGRAWLADEPKWVEDIQDDPKFTRASQARDLGVCAGLAVPIPVGGRTEAVLEFYTESPLPPDQRLLDVTAALVHELGQVLERQRNRERLQEANEQLAEMADRRADFLNLAAHELRNPLTPLAMQLQLLKRAGPLNQEQVKSMHVIDRSVLRLREIVDDLIEGARAQSGTLSIEWQEMDLGRVVEHAMEAYAEAARSKGVAMTCDVAPRQVRADPTRIAQVLDNLVSNAIKFTPPGGRITIQAGVDGNENFLVVEDTGSGIDPVDHHRLFQPFSQVHKERDKGGTGLGLYVCQAIMEAHGGRMGVQSSGGGSRFWARWPA